MKQFKLKNGQDLIIKKAKLEDAKDIIDYVCQTVKESDFFTFGEGEFDVTVEREEMIISKLNESDNGIFIVAVIDNKIVGILNFSGGSKPRIKHTGEFGLSVSKDYWRLGIGRELITYLIDWAKQTNIIKKINLRVREDNERGIKLYTKLGFKKEGIISRDFYVKEKYYNSVCMGLELD